VSIKSAPGLVPGANRVAVDACFCFRAKTPLHRGMLLPLQLQEVGDRQILGLHPLQEDRIVLAFANKVDMIVTGEPLVL